MLRNRQITGRRPSPETMVRLIRPAGSARGRRRACYLPFPYQLHINSFSYLRDPEPDTALLAGSFSEDPVPCHTGGPAMVVRHDSSLPVGEPIKRPPDLSL